MIAPALRWAQDDADGTPVWVGHSGAFAFASVWERGDHPRDGWGWTLFGVSGAANGHEPDLDAARAAADAAWRRWCESAKLVAADERHALGQRVIQAARAWEWIAPVAGMSRAESALRVAVRDHKALDGVPGADAGAAP